MNADSRTEYPGEEAHGHRDQSVRLGIQDFEVTMATIWGVAFRI